MSSTDPVFEFPLDLATVAATGRTRALHEALREAILVAGCARAPNCLRRVASPPPTAWRATR
ncbi:hypothetical protein L3D22_03215 [Lysobacter soli]|uniref:hypothetical protein n=1 Tax=Lysobacter soli TaxID=453783 RepID=UPI00209F41D2|nr:hypothetical protein [Lysobacter soli]UTA54876.1 hypothetical protein L3D22_03215 [Lysobacter soli]